ncbi:DHA2 family efflux MFS transporter permease subunit [Nocardia stercoris]|uniref:DHA2 family efflux MFS transporter permease subunit n=1 Tax=Nocardia stercoris TaxID=2483361 RepID=A0A3M2LFH3_9NOCA|nr:DHA2 family efflux MFS transporter permease subunit [Nocardia stercoris]RMI33438.1 DHA2 family efflux MFS transporter permease subunit [Nocardia stercoris]
MTTTQRWTLALASTASLMVGLDALVVVTALTAIRHSLGAGVADLEWTINAYTLAFAVLLLTASAIGDRVGRRRMLAVGLGVFAAASAACALAPGVGLLIAARAVQGAGAAMTMPAAFALVGSAFGPRERGKAMGIFAGITGLAILGGPVLGGLVVQGLDWQWIFWLNVPIGVLAVPLVLGRVTESVGPARPIDVGGVVLSGLGVLGLVWGLARGNTAGWTDGAVIGSLVGGVVLLAAFAVFEGRTRAPMVPLPLFADRTFRSANVAGLLMTAGLFGTAFFFAQYLQVGLHQSALRSGLGLLPWTATLFVVAPIAGKLADRIGNRPLIVAGLLGQAAGTAWIAAATGHGYAPLVPAMMVAGIGISCAMPAVQNAVLGAVAPESIGVASGVYNTMRQLGGALGVAGVAAVFTANGGYSEVAGAFRAAMLVTAAIAAAGAVAGSRVSDRRAAEFVPAAAVPVAVE